MFLFVSVRIDTIVALRNRNKIHTLQLFVSIICEYNNNYKLKMKTTHVKENQTANGLDMRNYHPNCLTIVTV